MYKIIICQFIDLRAGIGLGIIYILFYKRKMRNGLFLFFSLIDQSHIAQTR